MNPSKLIGLCCLILGMTSTHAELNSTSRVRAFAQLPNWTGLWEADNKEVSDGKTGQPKGYADVARLKLAAEPPYNAQWKAKVEEAIKTGATHPDLIRCSFGFPAMMDGPGMFQVLVQPEETVFLFHGDDVRHVYTDARHHPAGDDLWPTPVGDSIGHWEGETLVIDTIARKAGPLHLNPYYSISDQAQFVERVRMIDRDTLEDQMVIEDHVAFNKPMQVRMRYKRVKDLDRVLYQDCSENDRNPVVNGEVKIAPPP